MKKRINKILTVITAVTFAAALTLNIQASLSDPLAGMSDEALAQTTSLASSDDTNSTGWFWKKRTYDVICGGITWERWDFYDDDFRLLGTAFVEGGIVRTNYDGEYSTVIHSEGVTGGFTLKGWQCLDGWSLCTNNINPCKG